VSVSSRLTTRNLGIEAPQARDARVNPLLLWSTVALLLVTVGRIGEIVPGLYGLPLAKIALALSLVGFVHAQWHSSSVALPRLRLTRWFFAFMGMIALSIVFSVWKSQSLKFILWTAPLMLLVFVLVSKAGASLRGLRQMTLALVACGAVLACGALLGYAGGRAQTSRTLDANDLAYVLITLLPLAIALAAARSGVRRWLMLAAAGFIFAAALLTQSRGGLIGIAAIALYVALAGIHMDGSSTRLPLASLVARTVILGIVAVGTWALLPADARERFSSISDVKSDYNYAGQSRTGRIEIWKRNLGALARRPIGHGVATFQAVDGNNGGTYLTAHNSIVQASVEIGVLGGVLFVGLYVLAWRTLSSQLSLTTHGTSENRSDPRSALIHALRAGLLGSFAAGFFLSQAYSFVFCAQLALVVAVVACGNTAADIENSAGPGAAMKRGLPRSNALPLRRS
jgi:O-antigen ligase